MSDFLINAKEWINKIELVQPNADFIAETDWFGHSTDVVSLIQPAERYKITFNDLTNFGSKTLCFGDLIKSDALFEGAFKRISGQYEQGKYYHIFNSLSRFGTYMLLQYRNGEFVVPGFSFEEFNKVMNKYMNIVNGTDENGHKTLEVTLPYARYFTLNAHIVDYSINQQGAMGICAPVYSEYNFDSKKAFAIVDGWITDFYTNDYEFETDGENANIFYTNKREEIKTQEDFIKENFNCIEYSKREDSFYGFFFNIPFQSLVFKGVVFKLDAPGANSYFSSIQSLDSKIISDRFCNVNKFIIYNYNGPYLSEFDNSATITNRNTHVNINDREFNQLDDFLYFGPYNPRELLKHMKIKSTELYRKTDTNASGLSANWGYYDALFLRLTFTFDMTNYLSKLSQNQYFVFYFPRLIRIGTVSKNFITLPTSEHFMQYLEEDDYIFSFQQPGGASSNYLDNAITTTGVDNDYCISIHKTTLDGNLDVANCESFKVDGNIVTITTSIPLMNHCLIKASYENELYRNEIQCLQELFNQSLYAMIVYHEKPYFQSGFIPPYLDIDYKENTSYLRLFHDVYKGIPSDRLLGTMKKIYSYNGSQSELSLYQRYAKWYQNGAAFGGEVWTNIFCRAWKFRNIPCLTISKIKNNNNFNLQTIPIFKFDILPSFPDNTYGEDYCPNDTVNECLIMPNDSIDYKNVSEIYESSGNKDIIRLESYIKHIPLQAIGNDIVYELLGLLPGFGTVWKKGG